MKRLFKLIVVSGIVSAIFKYISDMSDAESQEKCTPEQEEIKKMQAEMKEEMHAVAEFIDKHAKELTGKDIDTEKAFGSMAEKLNQITKKGYETLEQFQNDMREYTIEMAEKLESEAEKHEPAPKQEPKFILNKDTKIFHDPSCRYAALVPENAKDEVTELSQEELEQMGFKACGHCLKKK